MMSDIYIFEGSRKLDIIDFSIELFISLLKFKSGKRSCMRINISNKIIIERVKPNNIPPNLSILLIIVSFSVVLEILRTIISTSISMTDSAYDDSDEVSSILDKAEQSLFGISEQANKKKFEE